MLKFEILTPEQFETSTWSGGKTKTLCLFPPSGDYQERRFCYRLSTATILQDESRFTPLPGFHRLLMTLDSPVKLYHLDLQKEVQLRPFEAYRFEGHESINSQGKCRDFNVMFDDHYQGDLEAVVNGQLLTKTADVHFVYALVDLSFQINELETGVLKANHLLKIVPASRSAVLKVRLTTQAEVQTVVALWTGLTDTNFVFNDKFEGETLSWKHKK